MNNIDLSWIDFKANITSRNLYVQWFIKNDTYYIFAYDNILQLNTKIDIEIVGEESADQLDFEANFKSLANKPLEKKSPLTGRPEVIIVESEGDGETLPSHNFMDKTTWYQESIRVTAETPSLDTGKTYSLAHLWIIDTTHGKITFEDDLVGFDFKAYDGSTELTIETQYTVDYTLGKIILDTSYTLNGALTVDYSYAGNSTFTIKPITGQILSIKDAEIQFTKDLVMKPMTFEIWAYDPNDLPNKKAVFSRKYKSIKDIINIARQGKGSIPAIDVFTQDILVFPFAYDRKIALEDSKGMELRVRTDNDLEMGGEYGTITFYVTYEDEI